MTPGDDEMKRENTEVPLLLLKNKCTSEYIIRDGKGIHKNNFNPRESTQSMKFFWQN